MNNFTKNIILNDRQYPLQDIGEGPTCLFLTHQKARMYVPLNMLIKQLKSNYRLLILDVTDNLPADVNQISESQIIQTLDDLCLLCDVYWLDKVFIRSDYEPDLIRARFKEKFFERYQSRLDFLQPEKLLH